MNARLEPEALIAGVRAGERRAVAAALNLADDARPEYAAERTAVLGALWAAPRQGARLIGVTGPPGVGKSTLTAALIRAYRAAGRSVAVLAVDPSSRFSGGALLGDRIRMQVGGDDAVFVRSLASRDHLGGLAATAYPAKAVLAAAYDRVILETVGVGQSETEIADAVDAVLLVLQPSSGDSIQFIKAGIMEIPDVIVLNKTDLEGAAATLRELRATLRAASASPGAAAPELVSTAATTGEGVDRLLRALEARIDANVAAGTLAAKRARQWQAWAYEEVRREVGRRGLERLGGRSTIDAAVAAGPDPFVAVERLLAQAEVKPA